MFLRNKKLRMNKNFTSLVLIIFLTFGCSPASTQVSNDAEEIVSLTPVADSASGIVIPIDLGTFTPDLVTYLPNPGIGWQDAHGHEEIFPYFPETIYYPVRANIAWKVLNPAKDVYDWSALDSQLDRAIQEGKQFSFRVYTTIYEEHMVPGWAIAEGVTITPYGDPDYSNCIYQEDWGIFVNALLNRYDGNPNIAFIDISGYGDFNEWGWNDRQTMWDEVWSTAFDEGEASPSTITELDAQARRRLADMFIGGSFEKHLCRDASGSISQTSYSYMGASHTQLVMPFAGIRQSTQYVFLRRQDIGFRFDCLGRSGDFDVITHLVGERWKYAPVVFELCGEETDDLDQMQALLQATHGSVVHNNDFSDLPSLQSILVPIGYRYYMEAADIRQSSTTGKLLLTMIWQNIGNAPNYPKMGQDFEMHVYVEDEQNVVLSDQIVNVNTATWLPNVPQNLDVLIGLPLKTPVGIYTLAVSIIDKRTGKPIYLAFGTPDKERRYTIGSFEYK